MNSVQLREIREGIARLLVPDVPRRKGPGKNIGLPFYNPSMEKNRDMSVLLLRALNRPAMTFLDGMSATGVLGIRIALETSGVRVTCNDLNPEAAALILKNAELNGVNLESVVSERVQGLLSGSGYGFIDIDPFGSPVPFLDTAFQAAPKDGLVGVTATDTAVLCGAHANACLRRYEARPLHIDCCKEIGLRILIGCCARAAARHDKSVTPLLSFSSDHYMRAIISMDVGARKADETLKRLGYVAYDAETGERNLSPMPSSDQRYAGPLWATGLLDADLISRLMPLKHMSHETSRLVDLLKAEARASGLFYDSDSLSMRLKKSPPRLSRLMDALHDSGFQAVRTHFSQEGIKTDAPWEDLARIYRSL